MELVVLGNLAHTLGIFLSAKLVQELLLQLFFAGKKS